MSQSNQRNFEVRRSEYRPLSSGQQRPAQDHMRRRPPQQRPMPQRPMQPGAQARNAHRPQQASVPQRPAREEAYRPQSRAAYAPKQERVGLPYGFGKLLVVCAIFVAVAICLQLVYPAGIHLAKNTGKEVATDAMVSRIYSNGPIRINEIMTSNRRTTALADGSSPDWIEVLNTGAESVNLKGYSLSKSADSVSVFTFPDLVLQGGQCALIYADSRLSEEGEAELHAPFRLSSAGDTLMLFNAGGTAIDTVNIPALNADHSYSRVDNSHWEESATPTPGAENTEANYLAMKQKSDASPIVLSELMAVNHTAYAAQDGMYYDYIELHNVSAESVNLGGWYLSDDPDYTRKWRVPDEVILAPDEYLIVFASGLDQRADLDQLHANFSLSSEGETLTFSDANGRIMDQISFDLMKADVAYALQADGTWIQTTATPAQPNF